MVIDVTGRAGWGALRFVLSFVEDTLTSTQPLLKLGSARQDDFFVPHRPWCLIECSKKQRVFLPALSPALRQAAAQGRLFWIQGDEAIVPKLAQSVLESGLCTGVLVHGLEQFAQAKTATLWGRRWQLAAQKGGTHLVWLHQKVQSVIGFDIRLEWRSLGNYEIKKGYGYFHEQRLKKTLSTQSPAA